MDSIIPPGGVLTADRRRAGPSRLSAFCSRSPIVLAAFAALAALPAARADFTGDFAPANWTLVNAHSSSITFPDAQTLTIVGPDDESDIQATAQAQITFGEAGTLAFHYQGVTYDAGGWGAGGWGFDRVGYALNGTTVWFDPGNYTNAPVSGDIVLPIVAGDLFSFVVSSVDSFSGAAALTITNFDFTPAAVPEPASVAALAGLGALGLASLRRRRRA